MVAIENSNQHGALQEESLITFEKKLGSALPQDYREFLLCYNGGEPTPSGFWINSNTDGGNVNRFYELFGEKKQYSIDGYSNEEIGIPNNLLPIGDDGLGNYLCLGIKGEEQGAIYFLDHDIYPFGNYNSCKGITKLANSFSEFLSALQTLPD